MALRRADYLPEAELVEAVLIVVQGNFGVSRDQVIERVARALGIRAISASVRERIAGVVERSIVADRLIDEEGLLKIRQ